MLHVSGMGSARILLDSSARKVDMYAPHKVTASPVSFPFFYRNGVKQAYAIPFDNSEIGGVQERFEFEMFYGGLTFQVHQSNYISRPGDASKDHRSEALQGWVKWMLGGFRELTHENTFDEYIEENSRSGLTRRIWLSIHSIWSRKHKKEPPLHLIVELSRDLNLAESLNHCSRLPRRVLKRIRAVQKVSKIQQLDAACIRDYAKRPGRTIREKAGARQELMGVKRTENMDTVENRVLCWTMSQMQNMAVDYRNAFSTFSGNQTYDQVRRILMLTRNLSLEPALEHVRPKQLHHPVPRNYPLQHDLHYKTVYTAYEKIIKEKKQLDDCWTWLRVTWSQVGRLVLYTLLENLADTKLESTASFLSGSVDGKWVQPPYAPGPLENCGSELQIFDSDDIRADTYALKLLGSGALFHGCKYVGKTGCDTVIVCDSKDVQFQVLVWVIMFPPDYMQQNEIRELQGCLKKHLEKTQSSAQQKGVSKPVMVSGLAVILEPGSEYDDACLRRGFDLDTKLPSIEVVSVSPHIFQNPQELMSELLGSLNHLGIRKSGHERRSA